MLSGINRFLDTNFTKDEMMTIYTYIGNNIRRPPHRAVCSIGLQHGNIGGTLMKLTKEQFRTRILKEQEKKKQRPLPGNRSLHLYKALAVFALK